MLMKKSDFQNT